MLTTIKLDAAEKQLIKAIQLYLDKEDSISTYTLTCASHEILSRIIDKTKNEKSIFKQVFDNLNENESTNIFNKINDAKNFFKHANKDSNPQGTIDWYPELIEYLLVDAASMYQLLVNKDLPCEILAYIALFELRHTELLIYPKEVKDKLFNLNKKLKPIDNKVIYERFLDNCRTNKKPSDGFK